MTKKSKVKQASWKVLPVAMIAVFGVYAPANAEKTINLTAIDGYPTKSLWV